jgi:hypothetical protein
MCSAERYDLQIMTARGTCQAKERRVHGAGGPASMARSARVPLDKSEGVVKGAVLDLVLLVLTLYFSLSSSPVERFGSALPPLQLGCRRRGGRTDVAIAPEAENQVADAAQEKEEDDSEQSALTE